MSRLKVLESWIGNHVISHSLQIAKLLLPFWVFGNLSFSYSLDFDLANNIDAWQVQNGRNWFRLSVLFGLKHISAYKEIDFISCSLSMRLPHSRINGLSMCKSNEAAKLENRQYSCRIHKQVSPPNSIKILGIYIFDNFAYAQALVPHWTTAFNQVVGRILII